MEEWHLAPDHFRAIELFYGARLQKTLTQVLTQTLPLPASFSPLTMLNRPILVLLPVYNGAAFLQAQLDSILAQTYEPVHIICRDDGSKDASLEILSRAQQEAPERISIVKDTFGNLGASKSFALLLQHALNVPTSAAGSESPQTPYVALCDQDDIWHPDKLSVCAAELALLEAAHPGKPALVHSDLQVVAEDGSTIAPSMARYQGLRTQDQAFNAQLLSNTLTGCTSLFNRQLIEKSLPIPAGAIMHDWWLSLVASAFGVRTYIDKPLIDYRQHASNAIGAKALVGKPLNRSRIKRWLDDRHSTIFGLNARQASAFLQRYRRDLSISHRCVLWAALGLHIPYPPIQRVIYHLLRKI
jgi:glycosyltransferase involved in cell wall biosynthesis